ncbi:hypothetical protein [Flavobacterium lotistagni]|uniref:hypothetical protein n=1 Tax=Flavobacterium lotistagni TaxID=2709660 RepID=UPI00293C081E|nr:hypothetical protein [Flavobacterium lotistagni]
MFDQISCRFDMRNSALWRTSNTRYALKKDSSLGFIFQAASSTCQRMKVVLVLFFALLASCTAVKYVMNEKIVLKEECIDISSKGIPVFEVELENKKQSFVFDSGATTSVVNDSNAIPEFSKKKIARFGSHVGADRKKSQNKLLTVKLQSTIFESENKLVLFSQMPQSACSKGLLFKGIVGLDAFFQNDFGVFLDFTNQRICNIRASEIKSKSDIDSYKLIKSECNRNQIFVFLKIDGKEHKFKLDTGYSGSIIFPFSNQLDFSQYPSKTFEGAIYSTINNAGKSIDQLYETVPYEISGEKGLTRLSVSSSIKAQNIGINFIKAFDWLIDYQHNKVYIKRNQNPIESQLSRKVTYYAKVYENKLVVSVKEKSQNKYQLGDQIVSVNGQKVTQENLCEWQDLVNKTDDWSTLDLEVIPAHP